MLLAKQVTSIDVLSKGRLTVGIGVGYVEPELRAMGVSPAAKRRACLGASGWYGVYLDVAETAAALADLRKVAVSCDRPAGLGELEITITPPGPVDLDTARRYADLGVHRLVIPPAGDDGSDMEAHIRSIGDNLVGRV